jgi:Trk-type K+ transport system membrane component
MTRICGVVREALIGFVAYVLYPAWLVAGAADYLCHRGTRIEETSGVTESWFHVAQWLTIVGIVALAVFFDTTRLAVVSMLLAAVAHTVLSYVDVRYTDQRRYISPFEQHVHAFLVVLPLVGVALLAILFWPDGSRWDLSWRNPSMPPLARWLLVASVLVLAGAPVIEELMRTYRRKEYAFSRDR